MQQNFKNKTV